MAATFEKVRWVLAAALLSVGMQAGASTVLKYPLQELDLARAEQMPLPQSVFHAWTTADTEAGKIIHSWQSEPVTVP
jgi:hypothetical protein